MITLIVGEKGSGKTKSILDRANDAAQNAKGNVAFLDKDNSHMLMLSHKIRLVNMLEHCVKNDNDFLFFIKGVLATDSDLTDIFIDGIMKITGRTLEELESFFNELDSISNEYENTFVVTVSCAQEHLPKYLAKFL